MNNTIKGLSINVIASFNNHDQDFFDCSLPERSLRNEKTLINFLKKLLNYPVEDLYKISLCWSCDKDTVNKYKTIKESINKNAKYFFENGCLIE
jgi:hypothetical protein